MSVPNLGRIPFEKGEILSLKRNNVLTVSREGSCTWYVCHHHGWTEGSVFWGRGR